MKRLSALAAAICLTAAAHAQPLSNGDKPMPAPIVFFDIAGPDLQRQKAFFGAVFGWETDPAGRFEAPVTTGGFIPALLRTDPAEKVIYFGVESIDATLAKITGNGGVALTPRMVVPGVTILALFNDPAGNRLGLIEIKDGKPIIP